MALQLALAGLAGRGPGVQAVTAVAFVVAALGPVIDVNTWEFPSIGGSPKWMVWMVCNGIFEHPIDLGVPQF